MYDVTKEDLLNIFYYDRDNGQLIWKNHPSEDVVGNIAGSRSRNSTNYTDRITIRCDRLFGKGKRVPKHRLIYFIERGVWLSKIDHIDGDGTNNHISNLRDGTGVNNRNTVRRKPKKNNTGLPQGVNRGRTKKDGSVLYNARGTYDGHIYKLYSGYDLFEACCARKSWENEQLKLGGFTKRHFGRE